MEAWLAKTLGDVQFGTASGWTLVMLAVLYYLRERREDAKVDVELKKLSSDDREALRAGFSKQVADLTAENRAQREEMQAIRVAADEARRLCQRENDQLRDEVMGLETKVAGLMRILADVAIRAARGEIDQDLASYILRNTDTKGIAG